MRAQKLLHQGRRRDSHREDLKGLKLRVPTTDLMSDTVAALGAQSTPISFSELYSALQTGTVDGAEQPHSGYYSNKYAEVAPNYSLTGHTYSHSIVIMAESVWNKLSDADKAIIEEAAKETEQWNRRTLRSWMPSSWSRSRQRAPM